LFTDIKELLPGQRCRFANDVVETDFLWKPNAIALEEPIEEQVEAANRLRQSTLESVSAWAGGYERILHRLSGGLDSSIVLAALMRAESRPQITCLNYFTSGRDGDERHFARLMAEHAGVPLVEFAADEAKVEMNMLDRLRRTIRPMNVLIEQARAAPERALIRDAGLQACFFGAGGDNIFFQPHTALGAIDHALRHGLRHGFMDRVLEAARLERRSLWSVLGRTLWAQLPGQSPNPFPTYGMSPDKALIHPDVYQAAGQLDVTHPWMHEGLEKLPPGKIMHIHMMTAPPSYYEALADPADFLEPVHPLFFTTTSGDLYPYTGLYNDP
jgi:asparagine synthase (glutamine-hydrolysing)